MMLTVSQLAERLGAELCGAGSDRISAVGPVEAASPTDVTFLKAPGDQLWSARSARHLSELKSSKAGAVIVGQRIEGVTRPQLIVKDVDAALIEALRVFAPPLNTPEPGVHPSALLGRNVKIGAGAAIGAGVIIDEGAEIGAGSVLTGGCKIGENSKVGRDCRLDSNVVVYHNCVIGSNVIIQANSTIGSTGFGYSLIEGSHRLVPHNGGVIIEDFVEIGANCCVDRAKFGNTIIGAGTKIDNLVQIAHNAVIGKCCLIAAMVGLAGSCRLGDGVILAGQSGVSDNIELGDGVIVGAQSGVSRDTPAGQQVLGLGMPALERGEALRMISLSRRLPKLAEQLKQLIKRIEKLEAANDNKE
ncbi:MAG: UDP-3-O-(3-hydroxymyristoyl)glucosamine N-acyltransferase [Planctomycetota bacterium]|jgi:UDP-3-O-[3-hydroxymyristoyl] glucosamine N-acyltransferase